MHEVSLTIVTAIIGHALYTEGHQTIGGVILVGCFILALVSTIMTSRH